MRVDRIDLGISARLGPLRKPNGRLAFPGADFNDNAPARAALCQIKEQSSFRAGEPARHILDGFSGFLDPEIHVSPSQSPRSHRSQFRACPRLPDPILGPALLTS